MINCPENFYHFLRFLIFREIRSTARTLWWNKPELEMKLVRKAKEINEIAFSANALYGAFFWYFSWADPWDRTHSTGVVYNRLMRSNYLRATLRTFFKNTIYIKEEPDLWIIQILLPASSSKGGKTFLQISASFFLQSFK